MKKIKILIIILTVIMSINSCKKKNKENKKQDVALPSNANINFTSLEQETINEEDLFKMIEEQESKAKKEKEKSTDIINIYEKRIDSIENVKKEEKKRKKEKKKKDSIKEAEKKQKEKKPNKKSRKPRKPKPNKNFNETKEKIIEIDFTDDSTTSTTEENFEYIKKTYNGQILETIKVNTNQQTRIGIKLSETIPTKNNQNLKKGKIIFGYAFLENDRIIIKFRTTENQGKIIDISNYNLFDTDGIEGIKISDKEIKNKKNILGAATRTATSLIVKNNEVNNQISNTAQESSREIKIEKDTQIKIIIINKNE